MPPLAYVAANAEGGWEYAPNCEERKNNNNNKKGIIYS